MATKSKPVKLETVVCTTTIALENSTKNYETLQTRSSLVEIDEQCTQA